MTRRGDLLRGWLTRPAMLTVWAFVFWGTLLGLVVLLEALRDGPSAAWGKLWPKDSASVWAWLNAGCVALAILTWTGVAAYLVCSRIGRADETLPGK